MAFSPAIPSAQRSLGLKLRCSQPTCTIGAFWVIWFFVARDILASAHTSEYYAFENAFPVADAWMASAGLLGAIAIYLRRASAGLWCIAGGRVSVYLAGLDILFDVQNGIYLALLLSIGCRSTMAPAAMSSL